MFSLVITNMSSLFRSNNVLGDVAINLITGSKLLTIKSPEQHHWRRSLLTLKIFHPFFLVFLLLTLNK